MKLLHMPIGVLAAGLAFATVPAQAAVTNTVTNAEVTSVTGANPSEGFAPLLPAGSPTVATISIDPTFTAAQTFAASPFQVSLNFNSAASALVQTCCINEAGSDLDPTDGQVTLLGLLGGFTGTPVGAYAPSASAFSITFRVFGADIPAATFATGSDVLSFFQAASLEFDGFARVNFIPQGAGTGFQQTVNFASAPAVPLPATVWLFLVGLGALGVRRRLA